jgi:AraC-like DNA-binding protein
MHEARMFLENYPTMTLEMIAESLGFYDAFHFSRTFKKLYGVSPSSYRGSVGKPLPHC